MACGHPIHAPCLDQFIQSGQFRCPQCHQSMFVFGRWRRFERFHCVRIRWLLCDPSCCPFAVPICPNTGSNWIERYDEPNTSPSRVTLSKCTMLCIRVVHLASSCQVALTPMPLHLRPWLRILCSDCHEEADVRFHVVGLKVELCMASGFCRAVHV
jgi:hypothetical protein